MPLFFGYDNFEIGKAHVLHEGNDVALLGTGTMTYQLLLAAERLANQHSIQAEVVHFPTIKPLDEAAVLDAAQKCRCVVTAEEGQIVGGFGSTVAELLGEKMPMPIKRIGIEDRFGQSGTMDELWREYGLDIESVTSKIQQFVDAVPQYQPGF